LLGRPPFEKGRELVSHFARSAATSIALFVSAAVAAQPSKPAQTPPSAPPASPPAVGTVGAAAAPPEALDWKTLEAPLLTRHVQVTSRSKFVRAGEQYFSPDGDWLVFQAVPVPAAGAEPDPHYSMYVAKIKKDAQGHVTGLEEPIRISAPDSYNTCGWFHPKEPWRLVFASTSLKPQEDQKAGFQVGTRSYRWSFPAETEIVTRNVPQIAEDVMPGCPMNEGIAAAADAKTPQVLFHRDNYDAECSYSPDGRFVLYGHAREGSTAAHADVDIWVYDTKTKQQHALVEADGYDGGPFFSPDGKMICYRSDRKQNDLLQIFVAELEFDSGGAPVKVKKEHQLTDNGQVNWAPFWHPSGKLLVYGNSGPDHRNYEINAVEVDFSRPDSQARTRRVSYAAGTDILPAFSSDGKLMVWCAQRGPMVEGETKPSSQIWIAECVPGGFDSPEKLFGSAPAVK